MKILNKFFLAILFVLFIVGFTMLLIYQYKQKQEPKNIIENPFEDKQQNLDSTFSTSTLPSTLKIYRNTEYEFEFEYPQNLILKENAFYSYYSKFNLDIKVMIGEKFDPVFLVNIVLPEFADRSFRGLNKITSAVTVAGVNGIKYEFEYEGFPHTTVILPFGELKMILATGEGSKQYLDEFNQILASFKFLK